MKKILFLFGLALATTFISCSDDDKTPVVNEVSALPSSDTEIQLEASEIVFSEFATGVNGGQITSGTVTGMLDGAHGTFIEIPIGEETVSHVHSNDYHSIVVKGIVENPVNGDASPKRLGPGSYWYQPKDQIHITKCADDSPEPCVTFFVQTNNFDFIPQN